MSKNYRANRRREPDIRQIDKQGWKSLFRVVITIVLTCVIAIGIPYGIYMYYRHLAVTDYFLPRQITIQGNVRVDDASILEASGLQSDGANLFEMDVHTIQGSIELLPWIKDARVEIELPDKVSIEVTEHVPLGIVHDGQMHVVDESGAYIKHWQSDDMIMVPIVTLDKPLSVRTHVVVEAFALAERITRKGYPHKIDEIHYDDATGYTVFTAQSEIRMGYDRFDERIERLMIVDDHLTKRNVEAEYILLDGEALDRVIVKPRLKPITRDAAAQPQTGVLDVPILPSAVPTPHPKQEVDPAEQVRPADQNNTQFPALVGVNADDNVQAEQPGVNSNTAEPAAEATKPAAEATKPAAEATKPPAEATKPAAEATKPAAEATKPAADTEEVDAAPPAIL